MSWLRELVREGASRLYGTRADDPAVAARIERELEVIETKDFPGLLPDRARHRRSSPASGGSSARAGDRPPTRWSASCSASPRSTRSSTTCRSSGSSPSPATRSPTSTSTSTPTGARRSSSTSTRSTAGTTPPRSPTSSPTGRRSAVRDMAKALGHTTGQQDAWSKQIDSWSSVDRSDAAHDIPQPVVDLAEQLLKFPRHLGIHSGGMVLTDRPVGEVCPIEHARMDDRTVLQWDKDDCAWMGLVKFDLLGLGHAGAPSSTPSTWPPTDPRRAVDAGDAFPRRSRASTTCSAAPTRSGCSRSRAGPRWARCPGCGRGGSTTW